jgi:hypothetical protein
LKGHIEAESGTIGSWNIGTIGDGWGDGGEYPNSLYSKTTIGDTDYLAFLRIPDDAIAHVFSIRTKNSSGSISYPFYVTKDGSINATKGNIGNWKIINGELSTSVSQNTYWSASELTIGTGAIHFENDTNSTTFSVNGVSLTDTEYRHYTEYGSGGISFTALTASDTTGVGGIGYCGNALWMPTGADYRNMYIGGYENWTKYLIGRW